MIPWAKSGALKNYLVGERADGVRGEPWPFRATRRG
jgi:hypothetical protein